MTEIRAIGGVRAFGWGVTVLLIGIGLALWLLSGSPAPPMLGPEVGGEGELMSPADGDASQSREAGRVQARQDTQVLLGAEQGGREFSGTVIDQDAPLRQGTVTAWADAGPDRVTIGIETDGTFKGHLPRTSFQHSFAQVTVADGQANAFSGLVRVGTGVFILVESTWRSAKRGQVELPDNQRLDDWFVALTSRNDVKNELMGTSDYCRGKVGTIAWVQLDPRTAMIEGPVDVVVTPAQPHVSYYGHRRFGSLGAFHEALSSSFAIACPSHTVDAGRVNGSPVMRLVLRSRENWKAVYYGELQESGGFRVAAPHGEYAVAATLEVGHKAVGMTTLTAEGRSGVEWLGQLPGSHVVRARVQNFRGEPITGLNIQYTTVEPVAWLHGGRGLQPTDAEGELVLQGLLPLVYEVRAEVEGVRGGALIGRIDATVAETQELVFAGAFRVALQIVGAAAFGVDAIAFNECRVWLRPSGGQWSRIVDTDVHDRGMSLGALSVGDYDFAVRGPFWAGVISEHIAESRTVLIPVSLWTEFGRILTSSRGSHLSGLTVRLRMPEPEPEVPEPWASCKVGQDGAFRIGMWARQENAAVIQVLREHEVVTSRAVRELLDLEGPIDIDR